MFVRALYTYDGSDTGSLSFNQGDILEVGDTLESGWWDGQLIDGPRGWFPSNYTTKISDEEALWAIEQLEAAKAATELEASDPYQRRGHTTHHQQDDVRAQHELEQELWASLSGAGAGPSMLMMDSGMDFSQGGDIFAEIAAAAGSSASASHSVSSSPPREPSMPAASNLPRNGSRNVPDTSELARVASSHSPQNSISSSSSDASLHNSMDRNRRSTATAAAAWAESDYWEPKLNETGQIYYINSRTGQTSADPPREQQTPSGTGLAVEASAKAPRGSISEGSEASNDTHQSMSMAFYNNLSLSDQSMSAGTGASSVPDGWTLRSSGDGGAQRYIENMQTGETRWIASSDAFSQSSSFSDSLPSGPSRSASVASTSRDNKRATLVAPPGAAAQSSATTQHNGQGMGTSSGSSSRHTPQPIQTHNTNTSRMSFYSDDSNLDNELHGRKQSLGQRVKPPTPKVSVMNPESVTPDAHQRRRRADTAASEVHASFPPELDYLDPPAPTLAQLEAAVKLAAENLTHHVRPSEGQAPAVFEYGQAGSLTAHLVSEVKHLLHCTGALDLAVRSSAQTSTSSVKTAQSVDESRAALLRPYTKKITSPLNKLVLEARALWGLMSTTDEEEAAVQESFLQGVETEDDLLLYRENRSQILRLRSESELQLRVDVAIKAQDIVKAVSIFCVFVSDLPPDALGPTASATNLPAIVRRPEGIFNSSVAALLGPGNGYGANWRGNGFVILPPQSLTSLSNAGGPSGVPTVRYQYPSAEFDHRSAAAIDMANQSALEEVSILRGAIAGLLSNNARNRLSQASLASDASVGSNTGVLPPTPLQSAQKHVGKMASHATQLSSSLSKILHLLDELKIAARLDLEIDPSTLSALLLYAETEAARKGTTSSTAEEDFTLEYGATLLKARQLLAGFEQAKQALYDAGPELLLSVQSIAMSEISDLPSVRQISMTPSPSQPGFASSLDDFRFPTRQSDPLGAMLSALTKVDTAIATVKDALITLLAVAESQSQAPQEARRVSTAARARIENQRLSQLSFNTFDSRTSSGRGTITAPDRSSVSDESGSQEVVVPDSFAPSGASSASSGSAFFPSPSINDTQQTKVSSASSNGSFPTPYKSYNSSMSSLERGREYGQNAFAAAAESPESSEYLYEDASPALRSPVQSKSDKLRRFFGDDAPQQKSDKQSGNSFKPDKLRKLLGDDAPPASAMVRKGSIASTTEPTPEFLKLDFEDEMSFGVDGQIKGGSLRALVAKLTTHTSVDHAFSNSFLMTYRTFTTSHELFRHLAQRYQAGPPDHLTAEELKMWTDRKQKLVKFRTVNVMKTWLESYLMEEDCEALLRDILNFAMSALNDSSAAQQILRVVEKRRRNGVPKRIGAPNAANPPNPILPRKLNKIKFLDVDPMEIARHLTIMDSRLCMRITPDECLSKAWPKLFKNECKNITAMITFNNATTHWVQEVILTQDDTRKRANTIKHFILVAERCHKLQNFAGLIDIVAGLTQTPISRLKRTWELVNQRHVQSLENLNQLMSPTKHFARYWEQLKASGPPCVPFLGVFLTSWTFIGDGMADFLRDAPDQINFAKRAKAAELMLQIELHQSTSYSLKSVPQLVDYLESCFRSSRSPADLWELSLQIEPRERDDEKIARLLSESGFL